MLGSGVPDAERPTAQAGSRCRQGKPSRKDAVSRCRSWIAIVAILIVATALAAVALPQKAEAATTKSKLRNAKLALRQSKDRLKTAEAALASAVAAQALGTTTTDPTATPTPTPSPTATAEPALTVDELAAKVAGARRAVRIWKKRVAKLARQYKFEQNMIRWEKQHKWMKIIEVAAAKYDVKADGMYRIMMRESGGQPYAGSDGLYKGLFQYWTGTWSASWNPWRNDSIYDGSSQIFATAYAIHKGMGPQLWTTTFASQY
jgi:type II secretory pathway pseudopilin PulG